MMPILAKCYPFLYLKTGTNVHDILNISIFQFHSSINDLNNEYCKRPNSIENWRNSSDSSPSINEYKTSSNSSSLSSLSVKPAIFSSTKTSASCCGMKSPDTHFGSTIPSTHCQPLSRVGPGYNGFAIWALFQIPT